MTPDQQPISDLRSDTLTAPTPEMREAMAAAEVGDDVFGEDPTVCRLESEGAAFLGQEATLFVPSGTMANQIAVHVHCRPGDELLCEERCHIYYYEGGGVARLSGTQVRVLRGEDGFPSPAAVASALRSDNVHFPRSRLLVLENTHNMAGGRVLDPVRLGELTRLAAGSGLRVHVDGARLANAAIACGCKPAELTAGVSSVTLCLSKGLGAPVGSLVAGTADFVARARRVRKAFGGGMRQAGVLAAAGLLALRDGPGRLEADHRRAAELAERIGGLSGIRVQAPETNIVLVEMEPGRDVGFLAHLRAQGVRALQVVPGRVRFVTHRDLTDRDVDRCVDAVSSWVHTEVGGQRP